MSQPKIALDARMWRAKTGGVSRYTQNLVTELLKIDTTTNYTLILTPADAEECHLKAKNLTIQVANIPHYSMAEQRELPKVLNAGNFDLVHFTTFNHPILYRRPFVCTVHDFIMHKYPSGGQKNSLVRSLAYRATMRDIRRAKAIIVPSEATKRDLIQLLHVQPQQVTVTLEGAGAELFHPHTQAEISAVRKKYALPARFLLFVSRLEAYKGIAELIAAYKNLLPEFPDLGLCITGTASAQNPEMIRLLKQEQHAYPGIITPGFVPDADLGALYSAASVFVHPSWYEGFGIIILEAFASQVPVVTSNISSLPEVAGDAAILVNPHEPKEITAAIRDILNDPGLAAALVKKGTARCADFSWEKMATETHALYMEALGG